MISFNVKDKRINRRSYLIRTILSILLIITISYIISKTEKGDRPDEAFFGILFASFIYPIQSARQRAHDINRNGWFVFIPIYALYLYFVKGDVGLNNYGEPPL